MNEPPIYGTQLTLEIVAAIRRLQSQKKPATNRAIRDYIAEKHNVQLCGTPKQNFTERITRSTTKLTELGYLRRQIKENSILNTFYYEYAIGA